MPILSAGIGTNGFSGAPSIVGTPITNTVELFGAAFQWKDGTFLFGNSAINIPEGAIVSINQVDVGNSVEVTPYYGAGQAPLVNGIGKIDYDPVTFTFMTAAWVAMLSNIPGGEATLFANKSLFNFEIQLYNDAVSQSVLVYTCQGNYVSSKTSMKVGPEIIVDQITIKPLWAARYFA